MMTTTYMNINEGTGDRKISTRSSAVAVIADHTANDV